MLQNKGFLGEMDFDAWLFVKLIYDKWLVHTGAWVTLAIYLIVFICVGIPLLLVNSRWGMSSGRFWHGRDRVQASGFYFLSKLAFERFSQQEKMKTKLHFLLLTFWYHYCCIPKCAVQATLWIQLKVLLKFYVNRSVNYLWITKHQQIQYNLNYKQM